MNCPASQSTVHWCTRRGSNRSRTMKTLRGSSRWAHTVPYQGSTPFGCRNRQYPAGSIPPRNNCYLDNSRSRPDNTHPPLHSTTYCRHRQPGNRKGSPMDSSILHPRSSVPPDNNLLRSIDSGRRSKHSRNWDSKGSRRCSTPCRNMDRRCKRPSRHSSMHRKACNRRRRERRVHRLVARHRLNRTAR